MKKLLLIVIAPLLLISCKNEENNQEKPPVDVVATFAPIVDGTWVLTDYLDELAKVKSPKKASEKLDGIVSMIINVDETEGDSVVVAGSWNNHEGYAFNLHFKQGQDALSLVTAHPYVDIGTDFYELTYTVKNTDTLLVLKKYGEDNKLKEERSFVKVTGPQNENSEPYGLQYMANKVLMMGKYIATDEKGKTSEVELTEDGLVYGLGAHTTFYIYTDFLEEDLTNMDEMSFDAFTKTQKPYVFDIKGDTLYLYEAQQNDERTLLIQGPLKYTLVKK